ncbi:RHS repeat-associated core domain-containing protein [Limnobaculum xujianqingii]|uniref:RHS repeat-associated core domain-containing protein n=1 Tax=Limnobaculum xujianqingii TaxID=2738837 RepID=UPI0015B87E59|nr:RHS repeat-associated core domain-containing protein [Limnobaculum xujianqingii]
MQYTSRRYAKKIASVHPAPLPTPHISLVVDIFDYLPIIGATTTIHGLKRTVAGTEGKVIHIPIGTWAPPYAAPMGPQKDDELFMGSRTVIVDGDPLTYRLLPTLSCNIVGIPAPFRPRQKDKPIPKALSLPLTANIALPHNVHVGGIPTISMMAMAMKAGLGAFKRLKKTKGFKNAMDKFKSLRQKLFKNMDSGFFKCKVLRAEPVDIRDRSVSLQHIDFTVSGRFPLNWVRYYSSANIDEDGYCGLGWRTLADTALHYHQQQGYWQIELPDGPLGFMETPKAAGRSHAVYGVPAGQLWYEQDQQGTHWLVEADDVIWRFTDQSKQISPYNVLHVSKLEDRNGNQWQFIYQNDQLVKLVEHSNIDATGREIIVTTEQHRILQMSLYDTHQSDDSQYELVTYEYDGFRQLFHHIDNQGYARQFLYQDNYYLCAHRDRLGQTFYYEYDDNKAVIRAWGDGGLYDYHFNWIEECKELEVTNSLGHTSLIRFSEDGIPVCEIDPEGGATFFAYDDWGRTVMVTEPGGRKTQWEYDEQGNLVKESVNGETEFSVIYQNNQPITITDTGGGVWQYEYDSRNNPTKLTNPLQISQQYRYDDLGQQIETIYPNGASELFCYTPLGFLLTRTDTAQQVTTYRTDYRGNLLEETNPLGHIIRYRYDGKDRLIRVDGFNQKPVHIAYDAEDQVIAYRDEAGLETQLTYNGTGEVTGCRTPDGEWIRYYYDTEDQLTGVENQRNQRWQIKRDSLGRIIEEVDYWGQSRHYQYDLNNHMVASRDALGDTLNFRYDRQGNLIEKRHNDMPLTQYQYNARRQITACHNPWRKLEWSYDNAGRLTEESQDGFVIQHRYNAAGQYTGRVSDMGNEITLGYNSAGQLSDIQLNQDEPIAFDYDELGRVKQEKFTETLRRELDYNEQSYITAQRVFSDTQPLFETIYQYDSVGHLTKRQDSLWGTDTYHYDKVGRLVTHSDPLGKIKTFVFDAAGNRLKDVVQQRYHRDEDGEALYRDSTLDGVRYVYDRVGQLVKRQRDGGEAEQFVWNESRQLIAYQKNGISTEYAYDGLGRRICKKTPERVSWYFWQGDALLAEAEKPIDFITEPDNNSDITQPCLLTRANSEQFRQAQLKCLFEDLREYVYYPGSFRPLALIDNQQRQKTSYYYHCDINGAPLRLTDAAGHIVWSERSGVWGEKGTVYANQIHNPLRFQGQYFDEESGLHYNRYRYYDPVSGGYVSQDPIGLAGGLNIYAYTPNALSWIDPLGLSCSTDAKKLGDNLGNRPTVNYRAHHMVMSNSKDVRMRWLRRKMDNLGLDINDAKNGVWLPKNSASRLPNTSATAHGGEGVHGNAYKQYVWDALKDTRTKEEFEAGLASIKNALENGMIFPRA